MGGRGFVVVMVALFSLVSLSYSYVPAYDSLGQKVIFLALMKDLGQQTTLMSIHT